MTQMSYISQICLLEFDRQPTAAFLCPSYLCLQLSYSHDSHSTDGMQDALNDIQTHAPHLRAPHRTTPHRTAPKPTAAHPTPNHPTPP